MNPTLQNLGATLARWNLAAAGRELGAALSAAADVYKLVFRTEILDSIWDESILVRLTQVFDANPPEETTFGDAVRFVRDRANRVRAINNLFFRALDGSVDGTIEELIGFGLGPAQHVGQLRSRELTEIVRARTETPFDKLTRLLAYITQALPALPPKWLDDATKCLAAIRDSEATGKVNALLIHRTTNHGLVVPLHAIAQDGTGTARAATSATPEFVSAMDRARLNLVKCGFMPARQDAVLMGELSDASYSGASIALGSAIALYSCRHQLCIDPFTAFTGDIKLEGGEWRVAGVSGIAAKLLAAQALGCRKVFLPADNATEIPTDLKDSLHVIPVSTITEVIACLLLPAADCNAESLQMRKVRVLEAACASHGWSLSAPSAIQDGSQLTVSPPTPPELKVAIYATGAHSPKRSDQPRFMELLGALNDVDAAETPITAVQETLLIKQPDLRAQIRQELCTLGPQASDESYCDFVLKFDMPPERLVVKQYSSGKLNIQGRAGALYRKVLEAVVTLYNVHHPNANLTVEQFLQSQVPEPTTTTDEREVGGDELPLPYIGTDESGKGDYFGPLVVVAVWADRALLERLRALGVRDSKTLSDKRCRELAQQIRESCRGSYEEVEISPSRYNSLYLAFKKEGKTLNHLLAWGHARALESLLGGRESKHAVADQFGDEGYILSKLMERGRSLQLFQTPKAERYLAVAAASVLARDRFLARLEQIGQEYSLTLPKGASAATVEAGRAIVAAHGRQVLERVAKVHFKTTSQVVDGGSA